MLRRSIAGQFAAALFAAALLLAPGSALAHPIVNQARAAHDSARHEEALELLDRAEQGRDLSRDDLVELLLIRALAHRALRQMDLAEVDMAHLASLDPTRRLGREVPPQLRRLFDRAVERVPGPIRVGVRAERRGEVVTIEAEVLDDVTALAQGFRLFARPEGGPIQQSDASRLDVTVLPGQAAEYWVEVLGPGGAVVASEGREAAPQRIEASATGDVGSGSGSGTGEGLDNGSSDGSSGGQQDEGVPAWPFIVGGVVLVVAAVAIVLAVVLTQPTDDTQLSRPQRANLVSAPLVLLTFE